MASSVEDLTTLLSKTAATRLKSYISLISGYAHKILLLSVSKPFQLLIDNWKWRWILYALFAWEIRRLVWTLWWKAPRNVRIIGYQTPFGKWLTAMRTNFDAEKVLLDAYASSQGKPFAIPFIDRYVVFVPDGPQAEQIERSAPSNLSLDAALHEISFTGPILGGQRVPVEKSGNIPTSVLKRKLRSRMPDLSEAFKTRVEQSVQLELESSSHPKIRQEAGQNAEWKRIRLGPALLRLLTRINLLVIVGDDLAEQPQIFDNMMHFFSDTASAFPILYFTPNFLLPILGPVLMGWGISRRKVYKTLLALAKQAVVKDENTEKPANIVQWTAEASRLRNAVDIAKLALGLVYASGFQVPMYAQSVIYRLCTRPECSEKLRAEALDAESNSSDSRNRDMPYLDSFFKETARLSPGVILSMPKTVTSSTYTSPDGMVVPAGNWVCIPQFAVMRDPDIWPGGDQFDGFRFVDDKGSSSSRLTHPSLDFAFWGSIRHACPARFYVSVILKLVVTRLLTEYEFKLEDPNAKRVYGFGKLRIPNPFATLLVRKRCVEG